MSSAIWKFRVDPADRIAVEMPKDARILSVQVLSDGQPYVWALVNPDAEKELRTFRLLPTGVPFLDDPMHLLYVGSFQINSETPRSLVFHVFELRP